MPVTPSTSKSRWPSTSSSPISFGRWMPAHGRIAMRVPCKPQYWAGEKRSDLRPRARALASERGLEIYPRSCCATAEIGLVHAIVIAQCRTGTARDDRAGLQHIAAACRLERVARILLD